MLLEEVTVLPEALLLLLLLLEQARAVHAALHAGHVRPRPRLGQGWGWRGAPPQ